MLQLAEWGPFDLIGGSPCNDLSMVNPLRKGLFGKEPTNAGAFLMYEPFQKLVVTDEIMDKAR